MKNAHTCRHCNVSVLSNPQEFEVGVCFKCQHEAREKEQAFKRQEEERKRKENKTVERSGELDPVVEELAAQLNEVCQCEAEHQHQGHSVKDYRDASESVKGFNRALAIFVLKRQAEARVATQSPEQEQEQEATPINPADYWIKLRNGETSLNGNLERGGDSGRQWIYVHAWDCEGGCEYSCNPLHPFNAKKET
ncbi:hypothetical protein LCGC14_0451210 [marine sediment metagenome]|uniref:Uncharacterized protein n=1 Tax=marine sediment metagenome TaxID=412755 RepID=A0A0F9SHT0_9ZZZZ